MLESGTGGVGAGDLAGLVKCFLFRHEDWGGIPSTHIHNPDMVVHVCHSRTGKVETGEYLELTGQPV